MLLLPGVSCRKYAQSVLCGLKTYREGVRMGSIVKRKQKDGSTVYSAQIVLKRDGTIVHRESKTFDRQQAAGIWLEKREAALKKPGGLDTAKTGDPTLRKAIERYLEDTRRAPGRTKRQVLDTLMQTTLAERRCSTIGSDDVVALAAELSHGRKPQTVSNYLSHLGSIFSIAKPAWGYPLDPAAMKDAALVAKRLGYTSKSRERDRRPTLDELDRILTHFVARSARRPSSAPMEKVVVFALFSTRRLEEIIRIRWEHFDEANSRILVTDMKNPGDKLGNDVWVDLPPEAVRILKTQPREKAKIFPYTTDAISAAFTRAGPTLGIEDLHFHDLRHEGVSRLFEMGWNIPHVAAVSGHRSWTSLKRYTHLRQSGDKFADWPWLDRLAPVTSST